MKKISLILLSLSMLMMITACGETEVASVEEVAKPVEVMTLNEETMPVELEYIGVVKSDETKEIGFKSSGKISKIYVEKGDYIKKGTKLAELDKEDLMFQVNASKSKLDAVQIDINKAKDSYDYAKELFVKVEELHESKSISQYEYDQAKLKIDSSEDAYDQAKSNYEAAKTDYDYKLSMVNDTTLVADIEGYVLDIKYEVGEMISSGSPIVVLRNDMKIVETGITQKDLGKISIGQEAKIEYNGEETKGSITNISQLADKSTRTYNVEISLDEGDYYLETIVGVKFEIGEESGIWIPINSILSSTIDYVYVVEDNRVVKKTITIEDTKGSLVKVKGLEPGTKLVINGMKSIRNGSLVSIID
ncbi:efflux RND transporter periplasmic adaptor subunit [Wukongibacter baidiensis]|uniref:efflux RND transporter periplasmic adaptor subunit n=1 Tax=Wukongibacter baidiensis TaxID=1723361 RepID=UPI003D7F6838